MKKKAVTVRLICLMAVLMLLSAFPGMDAAAKGKKITVTVNGVSLKTEHQPKIVKKKVMLPAAEIFESLGVETEWIKVNKLLIGTKDTTLFTLKAKSKKLNVSDLVKQKTKTYSLKTAPKLVKGTLYVSPQTIKKALGAKVKYSSKKKRVAITYRQ